MRRDTDMRFRKILLGITLVLSCAVVIAAQQPTEQRAALNEAATASDGKAAAAIEARLLTTVLNGSEDSPVTNVRIVVKNVSANFYTYVSGWATFYDSSVVRCGEGLFKLDALAPNESAEVDTPGLRLHCSPASWRIVATNLTTSSRLASTRMAHLNLHSKLASDAVRGWAFRLTAASAG